MSKQKITFPNPKGISLSGLFEVPESPSAYALFAHCFTCGKDIKAAARIAKALVDNNIAVLRFDFTGLGGSDGDFSNSNFSSNVADLVAAAEYLRNTYQAPSLLIGHSLGGAAVIAAAKHIPEAKGVVTIGAPADATHVMKQFKGQVEAIRDIGEYRVTLAGREFTIKKQFLDDIESHQQDKSIANLRRALLIFHSPTDDVVSIEQAQKIYQTAKHPKSFISLDSAASRSKCNSQLKNRSVLITKLNEIPPPKHRDRLASERTEPSRLSTIFFAKDPPKISSSVAETAAIHTPPGIA